MINKLKTHKTLLGIVFLGLVALFLPIIILLARDVTNLASRAALPSNLETEDGVLSSSGVNNQSDSNASGGQFVRFTSSSGPTPTPPQNAVYVPSSIDSTGGTDVQVELNNFIKNTPDGSTIIFKKDGTYQLSRMIWMRGRNNITLEGNGATLVLTGTNAGGHWDTAMHVDYFSENITVRNFTILGNHPTVGGPDACCSREGQSGIKVGASKNILIENMDISRVGGDCFTLSSSYQETAPNDGIIIRNNTCTLTGRMGMHTINSNNVTFENNYFDEIGYAVFSSEPNKKFEGVRNLVIKNNTIGTYSLNDSYIGAMYYYADASWIDGPTDMSGITITGNTVEGNRNGKDGDMQGIDVRIYDNGTGLRENVTITNNVCNKTIDASVKRFSSIMRFEGINGLTVTGNTQPISGGSFISQSGNTNVNISNNNTN